MPVKAPRISLACVAGCSFFSLLAFFSRDASNEHPVHEDVSGRGMRHAALREGHRTTGRTAVSAWVSSRLDSRGGLERGGGDYRTNTNACTPTSFRQGRTSTRRRQVTGKNTSALTNAAPPQRSCSEG
eukprot:scaffold350651_cov41-Prasinocladus_malaysianus.AAC.1